MEHREDSNTEATNQFERRSHHSELPDANEESTVSDSDLTLWDRSPPIAEISISAKKSTEREEKRSWNFHYYASLCAVVVAIIMAWSLFLLPQLCFFKVGICISHTNVDEERNPAISIKNCSGISYTGTQCSIHFGTCFNSFVNVAENNSLEENIALLFFILDTQSFSTECKKELQTIKEFVCVYSYQPCDANGQAIFPSRSVCEHLRDTACPNEWSVLMSGEYASLLPSCEELQYTNVSNCISKNAPVEATLINNSLNASVNSSNLNEGLCANVEYSGRHCLNYLSSCLVDSYDMLTDYLIGIAATKFHELAMDKLCNDSKDLVVEFLCQSIFPRCDLNKVTHLPNQSHCEYIRDQLCPNDWNVVQNLTGNKLPDCSLLSSNSTIPSCEGSPPTEVLSVSNISQQLNYSLMCNEHDGFFHFVAFDNKSAINNTCQARCSKWNFFASSTLKILDDAIVMMSAILGVVGTIAVLICSIIRKDRMLIFPSIFLIYGVLHVFEIAIMIVIQFTARTALSCSSDDLLTTTIASPTVFCSISGFALVHSFIGLGYWWFAHICITFWKIIFPFHAKTYEEKSVYIHAVVGAFGLLLPLVPPTLIFVWNGYAVNRFPPVLCLPDNVNVLYYCVLLPLSLIITLGICQLIVVFHVIHQKSRLFRYRVSKTHKVGLSTAEKKLLIVFVYYLILGYVGMIGFIYSISSQKVVSQYIQQTLSCESLRIDPDFVCPKQYLEARISTAFALLTYILLGIYPLINLVFAANKSEIQVKFVTWFPSVFTESFRASTLSSSIVGTPSTPFTLRRRLTYNFSTTDHIKTTNETATVGKSGFYLKKYNSSAIIESGRSTDELTESQNI